MRSDGSRRDTELSSSRLDIQIEKDPQHQHLTLTIRKAPQRPEYRRVHTDRIGLRDRIVVIERELMPAATPPRRPRVERSANHPRPRSRMTADLPPRHKRTGKRFRDLILGQLPTASHRDHRPNARTPTGPKELPELRLRSLIAHSRITPERAPTLTDNTKKSTPTRLVALT
jgi:hypothetical protein